MPKSFTGRMYLPITFSDVFSTKHFRVLEDFVILEQQVEKKEKEKQRTEKFAITHSNWLNQNLSISMNTDIKPNVCTWPWLPQWKYFGDAIQFLWWFHSWSQIRARAQRLPSERSTRGIWTGVTWTVLEDVGERRRTWADLDSLVAKINSLKNAWGTWARLHDSQKLAGSLDVISEVCLSSFHPALWLHFIAAGNLRSQDSELQPDDISVNEFDEF